MEGKKMLEAYSRNIDVAADAAIPFNNIVIRKGCTAILSAPASIQLNKAGVYMIAVDASIVPEATGDVSIQLSKNGILQPQAYSIEDGTADETTALSFTTLVQVQGNNTCACNTSPTIVQVINGTAGTFDIASVTVTKIC
jgi:hypothetical protein